MIVTHYSEPLFEGVVSSVQKSACGAYSERHDYSDRDWEVNCRKCRKALGYNVEEKTQ